ncbi:hypothetical protein D3C78_728890 [compost metagenome]
MNRQHAAFNQFDARPLQVFTQALIEARPIQQVFDVLCMLLAVPGHPTLGRQCGVGQGLMQTGTAQGLKHPLRDAFQCREAPPVADQGHPIAHASQPQGHRRTRGSSTKNQHIVHVHARRSGPR